MSSPRYDSVEDYLASLPSTKAQTLRSVVDFVLREFPDLEASGYVVRKNLFQVPDDWEMDQALVKDLVQARVAELDTASH